MHATLELSAMPLQFEQLYQEHHHTVFAAAYRVTGNAADAEDVLHTVFLRLLRREDPALIANPEGYLRRAAVNAALDIVRARRPGPDETDFDRMPSGARGAVEAVEDAELRAVLRAALARLPRRAAEIFALRYFEGRANPEIARELGVTQISVAVTLHRAKKKLQEELRKAGVRR
jgi:RNA polymerase sigma-70 factor (ECF subfamily)